MAGGEADGDENGDGEGQDEQSPEHVDAVLGPVFQCYHGCFERWCYS